MYGSVAQQIIREHHESLRREAARVRPAPMANRETTPYVVRDLSWELVRFLDTEDSLASTFATPHNSNGNSPHHE